MICSFAGENPGDFALNCQVTKGSFRSVVVPWNPIGTQERENGISVSLKTLLVLDGDLVTGRTAANGVAVEAIHLLLVLPQVQCFQAESLDVLKNWNQYVTHRGDELLILIVERILPKVVVQIPDQVYEALLLREWQCIVPPVKVRN
jgi:hypothetical protein